MIFGGREHRKNPIEWGEKGDKYQESEKDIEKFLYKVHESA